LRQTAWKNYVPAAFDFFGRIESVWEADRFLQHCGGNCDLGFSAECEHMIEHISRAKNLDIPDDPGFRQRIEQQVAVSHRPR
jgi:hypothetical protein